MHEMDILDIDEALKDDSFIFLEDKTHDDVSNILQQWKSNNCLPTHQQQQQEQVYKLNSRTFTRPKRRTPRNLESLFHNSSHNVQKQYTTSNKQQQNGNPMVDLEIGGLVTTMHKSFLQDTSPPSSYLSSLDASIERMSDSLITSADFTNINFLQSTQSLDFQNENGFNFTNKATNDGYTIKDMIRDRKALESLTMSSDGALIKDLQIAQIDDISLALSKTASGCSTMDNSTESVEERINQTIVYSKDRTFDCNTLCPNNDLIVDTTFNLVDNDKTTAVLNLKENSKKDEQQKLRELIDLGNSTFAAINKTICISSNDNPDRTFDCQQQQELQQKTNETLETGYETPENNDKKQKFYESTPQNANSLNKQYSSSLKMIEEFNISPIIGILNDDHQVNNSLHRTFEKESNRKSKINIENIDENIGNNDFNHLSQLESIEMLDNVENPNFTLNKSYHQQHVEQSAADIEMQNVMDLAQAEAELLADNDNEAEFEHMLDNFSKVQLNAGQLKMKKSLESIKKRFNYDVNASNHKASPTDIDCEPSCNMNNFSLTSVKAIEQAQILCINNNNYNNIVNKKLQKSKDQTSLKDSTLSNSSELKLSLISPKELRDSITNGLTSSSLSSTSASITASTSNAGERLLGRRSRLYDDINLLALSNTSNSATKLSSKSFTVEQRGNDAETNETNETELLDKSITNSSSKDISDAKTESNLATLETTEATITTIINCAQDNKTTESLSTVSATEKRVRDRDRFKTIKIIKQPNLNGEINNGITELNVPCIDGDDGTRDVNADAANQVDNDDHNGLLTNEVVNRNHKNHQKMYTKSNLTNYLTYKKPKDKNNENRVLPEVDAQSLQPPSSSSPSNGSASNDKTSSIPSSLPFLMISPTQTTKRSESRLESRLESRSLSRPRYLSGLQKFTAVSKATSTGALDNNTNSSTTAKQTNTATCVTDGLKRNSVYGNAKPSNMRGGKKVTTELKSPMGIKSKSFHNLTSNCGFSVGGNNVVIGLQPSKMLPSRKVTNLTNTKNNNNNANNIDMDGNRAGASAFTDKKVKPYPAARVIKSSTKISVPQQLQQEQESQNVNDALFSVPKPVSGIRPFGASSGIKRAGLVRPSSGYYSLSVTTKAGSSSNGSGSLNQINNVDPDAGRRSPTESLSSASSHGGSVNGATYCGPLISQHNISSTTIDLNPSQSILPKLQPGVTLSNNLGVSHPTTGIPKPSGLRPPSHIRRSALPRPSAIKR